MGRPAFLTFEAFVAEMEPAVTGLSHRYAKTVHPFTGLPDLQQEAFIGLWRVWQRYKRKPSEELCKLGYRAARNALNETWSRTRRFGLNGTVVVSLDQALAVDDEETPPLEHALGTTDVADMMQRFALSEIESMLCGADRAVLREILTPGVRTLAITRALLQEKRRRPESLRASVEVIAQVLDRPAPDVKESWGRIQTATRAWLSGSLHPVRPLEQVQEATPMFTGSDETLPNSEELGLGDPGAAAPAKKPAKTKATTKPAAKAAKKKPAAAAKKPAKTAKPKASKKPAAKKAAKPKTAKKGKTTKAKKVSKPRAIDTKAPVVMEDGAKKVTKSAAYPVGTKVKYLGGSRAKGLKTGVEGVIKRHFPNKSNSLRYGVRYPGRFVMMAAHFVKKI